MTWPAVAHLPIHLSSFDRRLSFGRSPRDDMLNASRRFAAAIVIFSLGDLSGNGHRPLCGGIQAPISRKSRRFTWCWKNRENRHRRKSSTVSPFLQLPIYPDTDFRASGEKAGMPIWNLHLMTRLPILSLLVAFTINSAGPERPLWAAPPEPSEGVRTADGEGSGHTFSDIVQAGAKLVGKN